MNQLEAPLEARLGIDENGLGPRLGPLVVTAVWANVTPQGARRLQKKLPPNVAADLNDSKLLLSCRNVSLGEAWARCIVERQCNITVKTPAELLGHLCRESQFSLRKDCPKSSEAMCWHLKGDSFSAKAEDLERVSKHLLALKKMGLDIRAARTEIVCNGRLNRLKEEGIHRFAADLHGMERLILSLREEAKIPVIATCGKVGGIGKYGDYFGPLSGRLHSILEEGRALSSYHFPDVGEIRFVRDADAADPLVMMASMVGKYIRELLMGRISRFYADALDDPKLHPSGYHDPVTARFVLRTASIRKRLKISDNCFERRPAKKKAPKAKTKTLK